MEFNDDLGSNPSECHIFCLFPLYSFFLCYPVEVLEGQISTGVSKEHTTTLILITAYKYPKKNTMLKKWNQLWTSIEKILYIYGN